MSRTPEKKIPIFTKSPWLEQPAHPGSPFGLESISAVFLPDGTKTLGLQSCKECGFGLQASCIQASCTQVVPKARGDAAVWEDRMTGSSKVWGNVTSGVLRGKAAGT